MFLIFAFSFSVGAQDEASEAEKMPDAYADMLNFLSPELKDGLPQELFSDKIDDVAKGANELSSPAYLLSRAAKMLTANIQELFFTFAILCAVILASAILRGLGDMASAPISSIFSFTSSIAVCITIFSVLYGPLSAVSAYLKTLGVLMGAVLPLMSALYLMGGNVAQAAINNTAMAAFLRISEGIIGRSVIPFSSVCMALSAASSASAFSGVALTPIGNVIKRTYTTLISLVAFFMSAALAVQSTLASRADTLAMKGVKFISSNMIPIVGAAVGEGIRTASASVSYIRGAVGTVALITLLLSFFSVFSHLLVLRFFLNLGAGFAEMLDCKAEKGMLCDMASLVGYIIAAISLCTLGFIFAITIFIKCACAVS